MTTHDMEESTMPTRWERVKQHVIRNRYWYAAGGLALVAGALGYSVGRSSTNGECGHVFEVGGDVTDSPVLIGDGSSMDNYTEINNYYGYSTKIVKCLETGEVWESVTEAAADVGVARTTMSKHLNGNQEHINGYHYVIIGQGTTGV